MEESKKANSVFLSGLPYDTNEDAIRTFFTEIGHITYLFVIKSGRKILLPKYQDSGRTIGYAHVEFEDEDSMKKVGIEVEYYRHWK